jgi:hypothetical protein
MFFSII